MQEKAEPLLQNEVDNSFGFGVIIGALTMKKLILSDILTGVAPIFEQFQFESQTKRIATISEKGFEVDVKSMEKGKKYLMNYQGSVYKIMRNANDELELFEMG